MSPHPPRAAIQRVKVRTRANSSPKQQTRLAKGIEYRVEIYQNFAFGNFGDVIHAFASKVPDPALRIREASQQRIYEAFHVWCDFNPKCNGGGRQPYKPTVAGMKCIRGSREEFYQLVDNRYNPPYVVLVMALSDKPVGGASFNSLVFRGSDIPRTSLGLAQPLCASRRTYR